MNTMRSRRRRIFAAAAGIAIATSLVACAEASGEQAPIYTTTPEAGQPYEAPAPTATIPSGTECLVGSWELRNETFEAALSEMLATDPAVPTDMRASLTVSLAGKSSMRFGDDGSYGAWQDDYAMIIDAGGGRMRHVQNSADIALYAADATRISVTEFQQLFVEAEMSIGDSMTVAVPDGNSSMASISFFGHTADVPVAPRELLEGAAEYTCSGDELTLFTDGFPSAAVFTRIPDIVRD